MTTGIGPCPDIIFIWFFVPCLKNSREYPALGADYMEVFNPCWNLKLVYHSKRLFKMTLRLQAKISTQYDELEFQLGWANPRQNFNLGWKSQIFLIIDILTKPEWKFDSYYACANSLFKIKMLTSRARFQQTDDKLINLIKY